MKVKHIVLVGCGGTGSKMAFALEQIIKGVTRRPNEMPKLWFLDGDILVQGNLIRQDFFAWEEGLLKSEALRRRHIGNFIRVDSVGAFVNATNITPCFTRMLGDSLDESVVVIAAVDNVNTRVLLLDWLDQAHKGTWFWVSPGNTHSSGQVLCYGRHKDTYSSAVSPREAFPEYRDAVPQGLNALGGLGCGMVPGQGTQSMLANMQAATLATAAVVQIIEKDTCTFSTYFEIAENGAVTVTPGTTSTFIDVE